MSKDHSSVQFTGQPLHSDVQFASQPLLLWLHSAGQAVASPTQRRNLLQELFADIALEVDDRARGLL
ncbi:hypothetical protein SADUNF_Sadunf09G0020500 [Salix dunnii]|uniref:Uncharacterized protein n=1 Tax=Salix dunnii TaxID=1413687 RepID=A0A835JTN0_9ROSI|nr:hypothetical protein SADUNF_Sadunf09G0020500 [Salix dunnii]